jgi:hypothetical protein
LPYASELPFALALLALVLVGGPQSTAFLAAFRSFARGAWGSGLSVSQALASLPSLLQPAFVLLGVPMLAAFLCMLAQRVPTLRAAADAAGSHERGRSSRGRVLHALLTALKALLLGVSLFALVFDSLAGWRDTQASCLRSAAGCCRRC